MRGLIMSLFLFFVSNSVFSDATETGQVTKIIVEGSIVSVWLNGIDVTTDCSGGSRWTVVNTDTLFKEKYAAILAAATSKQPISLFHLAAHGCGNWTSNKIYLVGIDY